MVVKRSNSGLHVVRASSHWDVNIATKKSMIQGKLVPTIHGGKLRAFTNKQRISVEIHGFGGTSFDGSSPSDLVLTSGNETLNDSEKIIIRTLRLRPIAKLERKKAELGQRISNNTPGSNHNDYDDEDDMSVYSNVSNVSNASRLSRLSRFTRNNKALKDDHFEWKERHRFTLDSFIILNRSGKVCDIERGKDNEKKIMTFHFSSESEAESFHRVVEDLRKILGARAKRQLESFKASEDTLHSIAEDIDEAEGVYSPTPTSLSQFDSSDYVHFLIEIVGCLDLPNADYMGKTDPYVKVLFGDKKVHQTNSIDNTNNPIWTVKNGSLFLLSVTAGELFENQCGLEFHIFDYDTFNKDDILGHVIILPKELTKGKGERIEYDIDLEGDFMNTDDGEFLDSKLILRYRRATEEDIEFMNQLESSQQTGLLAKKKLIKGAFAQEAFLKPTATAVNLVKRGSRPNRETSEKEFRVKPGPDPQRHDETKWMTKEQLQSCSLEKSNRWTVVGSGGIGKLYFEVIGCERLPNLDAGLLNPTGVLGNKTDAFVCIVYEDCVVNTDVINDCLSPRWMPWTQRAFCFHVAHPSSQLHLAVFDFDVCDAHDPVGRISIDITNFSANTVYTLDYELFHSALVTERKAYNPNPRITVRVRVEWDNLKYPVLTSITPALQMHVNNKKKDDFRASHYTCNGKPNVNAFSIKTIWSYIDEIEALFEVLYYFFQALKIVFLWRGTLNISAAGAPEKVLLPIHSIVLFLGGVAVTTKPRFLPAFVFFWISHLFLATMDHQLRNPSPFQRCKSYSEIFSMLMFNKSTPKSISPFENEAAINTHNQAHKERLERIEETLSDKRRKEEEYAEINANILGDSVHDKVDIVTKVNSTGLISKVDPMRFYLYPIQIALGHLVILLRISKSILLWKESFIAFWITSVCLATGFVFLWLPWGFIFLWLARLFVWIFLGPWWKIFDIAYFQHRETMTIDERKKGFAAQLKSLKDGSAAVVLANQVRRENAAKYRGMRKYMYGGFITAPPMHKQSRYFDYPLPSSSAEPYTSDRHLVECDNSTKVMGQSLAGDMIPRPEKKSELNVNLIQWAIDYLNIELLIFKAKIIILSTMHSVEEWMIRGYDDGVFYKCIKDEFGISDDNVFFHAYAIAKKFK